MRNSSVKDDFEVMTLSHVKAGLQVSVVLSKVFSHFFVILFVKSRQWNLSRRHYSFRIPKKLFKFWVSLEEHIQDSTNNYLLQISPNSCQQFHDIW